MAYIFETKSQAMFLLGMGSKKIDFFSSLLLLRGGGVGGDVKNY